jgi:hypothetical protein
MSASDEELAVERFEKIERVIGLVAVMSLLGRAASTAG